MSAPELSYTILGGIRAGLIYRNGLQGASHKWVPSPFFQPLADSYERTETMPRFPRAILVLSLVTVAALFYGNLHARDKTAAPDGIGLYAAACPSSSNACVVRPIWCPDDYCPKCPPGLCPPKYCGTCDCYDAKCPPCICPPAYCGTCDCYDAKCPPCLKIPCAFPSFYKCPPPKCRECATRPALLSR